MRAERGLREFVFVAAPKVLAGVSSVGINLLLLRYFRPEGFGLYALCLAAINIVDAVLGTAVDMAVMRLAPPLRDKDPAHCLAIQKAALYLKAAATCALCLLVALFASAISQVLFHERGHTQLLYMTCLAILALMLLRSAQAQMQIESRFELYGLLEFLQMTLKFGGIGIFLLLDRVTPAVLVAFFAIGPGATALLWTMSRGRVVLASAFPERKLLLELLHYVKWFLLTFSVAALVARIDVFLVSTWSSVHEAGIFSAGQTFAIIPQLIGTYLAVVLSPRVMPYMQQGVLMSFFRRFQTVMIASAILVYVAAALTLPQLGPWLLPAKFVAAQRVILFLLPGTLAGFVTFPLTITVVMFLRPQFLVAMDCIALPIALVLYHRYIPAYGAVGAACVTSAICVIKAATAQAVAWSSVRPAAEHSVATPVALEQICMEEGKSL